MQEAVATLVHVTMLEQSTTMHDRSNSQADQNFRRFDSDRQHRAKLYSMTKKAQQIGLKLGEIKK